MPKNYLLILLLSLFFQSHAQDVHVTLGKSSRNAISGGKAFNLQNLKYYAKLSQKAINQVIINSDFINCEKAYDLSESVSIHLESALLTEDFATAKSHLFKVEALTTEIFNEYNLCNVEDENMADNIVQNTNDDYNLSELEKQQKRLKQQQEKLEQQEKELRLKLEAQKNEKTALQKQAFINRNQNALKENINTYNTTLKVCNCNNTVTIDNAETYSLSQKDLEELKVYYLEKTILLTEKYMSLLIECKSK